MGVSEVDLGGEYEYVGFRSEKGVIYLSSVEIDWSDQYPSFSQSFPVTVAKAPLTITADDKTKNAGEENP